jgi:hypothetical protein
MALFISNGIGVHSIEDGDKIPADWSEITEAEARKLNPDLFGEQPTPKAPKAAPTK